MASRSPFVSPSLTKLLTGKAPAFLIFSLLVFGCSQKHRGSFTAPGFQKKQIDIVRELAGGPPKVESISALARISVTMPDKKRRIKEIVIINSAGDMRFETLNPFGQTSVLLIKEGARVLFHNLMDNNYMLLREESPVLEKILGVPITLGEVKRVLFQDFFSGLAALPGEIPGREVTDGLVRLDYDEHYKKIRLNGDGVVESVFYHNYSGKILFSVSYSRYIFLDKISFPKRVDIVFPAKKVGLRFDFKDISVNGKIDSELFTIKIPGRAVRYQAK